MGSGFGNNKFYLYSISNIPGSTNFNYVLYPIDSNFNLTSDSIKSLPISYANNSYPLGKLRFDKDEFLYSTSSNANFQPFLIKYNFTTNTFKSKLFTDIIQDGNIVGAVPYLEYPSYIKDKNNYILIADTARRRIFLNNRIEASSLIRLDSNLNTISSHLLKYPVNDTISETGLKYVKDLFKVGSNYIAVGTLNRSIPSSLNSNSLTNEIGVISLDSNFQIKDTIRVSKPSNRVLTTGYMNTACWCDGKLFVAATLQSKVGFPSRDFDEFNYPQGLIIARVDTPFSLAWSKRIFIPGRQFRLYDVHCLKGKMILGGLFIDSTWVTDGGVFSIEVDPYGNYLPLNTSEVSEQAVMNPYPNPFEEQLRLPIMPEPLRSFALYDLNGKLHRRFEYPETELSIPGLPSGLYLWQAESISGNLWRGKVVRK